MMEIFNDKARRNIPRAEVMAFITDVLGLDPHQVLSFEADGSSVMVRAMGEQVREAEDGKNTRIYERERHQPMSFAVREIRYNIEDPD